MHTGWDFIQVKRLSRFVSLISLSQRRCAQAEIGAVTMEIQASKWNAKDPGTQGLQ